MTSRRTLRPDTDQGPARAVVHRPDGASCGSLLLGHGAGGGTAGSRDLQALTALTADGWTVVLVDQPWVLAGRGVAPAPATLDRAWAQIEADLRRRSGVRGIVPGPWVLGGRSAGARVACRAAARWAEAMTGPVRSRPRGAAVAAVLALSFPLRPPDRPEASRAHEALAAAAAVPVGIVQGARDPFGGPDEVRAALGDAVTVLAAAGDHSFTRDPLDVVAAARTLIEPYRG